MDERLLLAVDTIRAGKTRLLSIDVFDTLLARRVPKPTDVFLRLGVMLRDEKALGPGQTPDSFAAIRYQTEAIARNERQREFGDREVTLTEVYEKIPNTVVARSVADMVAAEIAVEHELCFVNGDMVQLINYARDRGVSVAYISNSYFSEKTLRSLLKNKDDSLPEPDAFFVSNEYRRGKRDGLMKAMLDRLALAGAHCLHIGDDPVSDAETAKELGVLFIYYGFKGTDFAERLDEEHPVQWHERAQFFSGPNGDCGLSWLRRKAGFWRTDNASGEQAAYFRYGAQMLGPLLSGFGTWVIDRCRKENTSALYGVTREGDFLGSILKRLDPGFPVKALATSRIAAALAAFSPDYPAYLEDFFTRRGHWTLGALMEQLGFTANEAALLADPQKPLEIFTPALLTKELYASPLADRLFEASAARRQRLLRYLKSVGTLDDGKLFLMDVGYAATIQRAIQRIFTIEKLDVQTHGLYLVSAHVSLATQLEGGIVEGFLAQNGNPNDFARAFCRSPEIVELSCMPAYGSVIDYKIDGEPVTDKDVRSIRQKNQTRLVQKGAEDFAEAFRHLIANMPYARNFMHCSWKRQMRAIAKRIVVYPSCAEAQLFAHWEADSDLGLASPRAIVPKSHNGRDLKEMTATQLAGLPRRDIAWLYGTAAILSYAHARQAASLMLRQEIATAFFISANAVPVNNHLSSRQNNALSPAEKLRLAFACDAAVSEFRSGGKIERKSLLPLLMQPSVEARLFVFLTLSRYFQELGQTDYAYSLQKKSWRIGLRDHSFFKSLRDLGHISIPNDHAWRFLKEALVSAMSHDNKDYILEVINCLHDLAYKAYRARLPYTYFQDSLTIEAIRKAAARLRPVLPELLPLENRRLRIGYVLSGEVGETYSPITDITFALADTHEPHAVDVSIISVHHEDIVRKSAHLQAHLHKISKKNQKLIFLPPTGDLKSLADNLASLSLDALVFTTLSGHQFALAAMRPAYLVVGFGLGEIDLYTSPLLDFTAHIVDLPLVDSLCRSYRLPNIMPAERYREPARPISRVELGVSDDAFILVSSGRSVKFFSQSYWEAIQSILTARTQVYVVLMGPTYDELSEWLSAHFPSDLLKRVRFLGWRDDHAEVLKACDAMLDTFPMGGGYTLIEAMHLGIPTVLCHNKVEDFLELYDEKRWMPVGEAVEDPLLSFDWDDKDGIIKAVLRLIDQPDLRTKLGEDVRKIAQVRRSIKPTVKELEVLVRKHLSEFL
ncbi:MAG: glycosyltransferase [Bdellovibrionales bacterium]